MLFFNFKLFSGSNVKWFTVPIEILSFNAVIGRSPPPDPPPATEYVTSPILILFNVSVGSILGLAIIAEGKFY